ncbi:UDP-glucose 4-epimerase [Maribacter sedimenticola]|uniref:UDP-glucose 4-epimerase n=1 Tax=Maribacter sedimenticola TaxID=228956 RepID=A0ABY1SC00_9FLAO|nr:GDP-mannose 4,6-dehydratase [Maribacter sedimenticola]SNR24616.1 UDP-glucose 4-epimerase [Maribacter sedimenticola]
MEEPFKKTVLITGIGGFTGVHLEAEMTKIGYRVFGTTNSIALKENHYQCDILNKECLLKVVSIVKPNFIIHLAAISFVASKDVTAIYNTNILGTLNLLECLDELKLDIKKVLLASSAAIYGNIEGVLNESLCPKPVNHYGNSKLVMENMVASYYNKFEIIIARPFNYTGIGQNNSFLIPKIVQHFREKNSTIKLGNLHTFREYNNVSSFSEIYIKLLNSSFHSDKVNICSGSTYSIGEILGMLEKITGHYLKVEVNPLFIRKNEIVELKGSTDKLFNILGGSIKFKTLETTLSEMLTN